MSAELGREPGAGPRAPRPAIVLELPSATEFLSLVRSVTLQVARLAAFEEKTAENVSLAVDECTTNVIEHAYAGAADQRIRLDFEYRGGELSIEVLDSGTPVDPETLPKLDLDRYVSERRTGGLGVHLMGRIMDSVGFRRARDRNVCRMVKRKPGTVDPVQ